LIRYICLVGPALLGLLFLLSEPDQKPGASSPQGWTAEDSLRAMAHLGEPMRDRDRDIRFARTAIISSARADAVQPAPRTDTGAVTAQPPAIMNAQARMESPKMARARNPKPRKTRIANRRSRIHTAIADNPQRMVPAAFQPPSW
jgi:hypothetical protein